GQCTSSVDTQCSGISALVLVKEMTLALRMLALLTVCFAAPRASAATFVYVGNSDSQDITVFRLDGDGRLAVLATIPVPGPAAPGTSLPLASSPDKKFLYAGLRNQPYSVVTFSIDPGSGKLTLAGTGPLANSMAYIVTDRTGRFLLAAS